MADFWRLRQNRGVVRKKKWWLPVVNGVHSSEYVVFRASRASVLMLCTADNSAKKETARDNVSV
jgi:hypothetical protein